MTELSFKDDFRLFDGDCVRFYGYSKDRKILCGVTTYALLCQHEEIPQHVVLPGETFLQIYDENLAKVHSLARKKFREKDLETTGEFDVIIHDHDWQ
ncbi:MAG: hypothetical protein ACR2OJ_09815 [Hyphomicrobiales bacterium]